jgi:hypothetical protein
MKPKKKRAKKPVHITTRLKRATDSMSKTMHGIMTGRKVKQIKNPRGYKGSGNVHAEGGEATMFGGD